MTGYGYAGKWILPREKHYTVFTTLIAFNDINFKTTNRLDTWQRFKIIYLLMGS